MMDEKSPPPPPAPPRGVLSTAARLLTFTLPREGFAEFNYRHLLFGLG